MSTHELKRRRGTTEEHKHFRGAVGELTVDTDKNTVVVHDGCTYGGHPLVTQRDLFEFLGKEYFINIEDLSDDLKAKLDVTLDINYIEQTYRKIKDKIDNDDLDLILSERINKILKLEEEFKLFLECIKSSELSIGDKQYGASIIGFCTLNNRFSNNVLTVQDAIDELSLRLYYEEYITSKLNKLISEYSTSLKNFSTRIEENNRKFLIYGEELTLFKNNHFNPLKEQVEINTSEISNIKNNVYSKLEVDNKIAETINTSEGVLNTIVELTKYFENETNLENIIEIYFYQLSLDLGNLQQTVASVNSQVNALQSTVLKNTSIYGSGIFNSNEGYIINHNLNTTEYNISITPTSNPNGKLGEIWVEKTANNCVVYCSGSTTTTTFDYLITVGVRYQ